MWVLWKKFLWSKQSWPTLETSPLKVSIDFSNVTFVKKAWKQNSKRIFTWNQYMVTKSLNVTCAMNSYQIPIHLSTIRKEFMETSKIRDVTCVRSIFSPLLTWMIILETSIQKLIHELENQSIDLTFLWFSVHFCLQWISFKT